MKNTKKPRVLIADTNRWALSSRVAVRLTESGCEVGAICPRRGHALRQINGIKKFYSYSAFRPTASLLSAIDDFDPDIILPACDRSVEHLHELHELCKSKSGESHKCISIIEKSLGVPSSYPIVSSRHQLLALADQGGVRTPTTWEIHAVEDLDKLFSQLSVPLVVKVDGTWGGTGVRVIRHRDDLQPAWDALTRMSGIARGAKRLLVNRDPFLLGSCLNQKPRPIIAQKCVEGRPTNCTVFAWAGEVRSIICVEVIAAEGLTGPASVVRIVNNETMRNAAEKIAGRLGISGFFGLDFMIEDKTADVYLVEMNPRLAPPCHLRLGNGRDLIGALCESIGAGSTQGKCVDTEKNVIAYFPGGRPQPDAALDCYNDTPVSEPALIKELLNPYPDRTLLFRIARRLTDKPMVHAFDLVQIIPSAIEPRGTDDYSKSPSAALDCSIKECGIPQA